METQQFANFFDFQRIFQDNTVCLAHLEKIRWAGKPICPKCGQYKHYKLKGIVYKCANPKCYKQFTVLMGSAFENTKIPLNKWFWAVYVATSHKKGIASAQLSRDIAVTQKTAWFMLHRIREMPIWQQSEIQKARRDR